MIITLATEDELSEAIGLKLIAHSLPRLDDVQLLRRGGSGYLRSRIPNWIELASRRPVVIITDLDEIPCPTKLIQSWLNGRKLPDHLIFRVAVREIEAWLLADREAMTALFGAKAKHIAPPEDIKDPKQHLLQLAKKSSRAVRDDLVKLEGAVASQGIGYNARLVDLVREKWSPERAAQRSPSLHRSIRRIQKLSNSA